jgi:hypothetical protein
MKKPLPKKRLSLTRGAIYVALSAILTVAYVAPAHADRDWDRHAQNAHRDWHHWHGRPGYVEAPPVVYAPPVVESSPGLNLILPINIR